MSLFAMCGLLGLAIDLGWSYFVKKSAQNAADAGALAAAYAALSGAGETVLPFHFPAPRMRIVIWASVRTFKSAVNMRSKTILILGARRPSED